MSGRALRANLRIIVFIFGLLLAVAGVYVILHAFGAVLGLALGNAASGAAQQPATDFSLLFNLRGDPLNTRLLWALGGLGALLAGLLLLGLALMPPSESRRRRVVLSDQGEESVYGGGRVTVSQRSLRDMTAHVAKQIDGVREAHPRLTLQNGGWHCHCRVSVLPSASLPAVTSELKSSLHKALEHHTGLPVQEINIDAQLDAIEARRHLR